MKFEIIESYDQFLNIEKEWNELVGHSLNDIPFLRHEWIKLWWNNFVEPEEKIQIVLVRDNGKLIAGAPFLFTTEKGYVLTYRVLKLMVNSHSYRSDIVIHREYGDGEIIEEIWRYLKNQGGWDYLKLRDVPEYKNESVTIRELKRVTGADGFRMSLETPRYSPIVILEEDWETYFKKRKGHFRRNLNRREKKLGKEVGEIRIQKIEEAHPQLHELLDKGFEVEASGWKGEKGSAILKNAATRKFYHQVADEAIKKGWLKLYFLYAGEQLLAFDYCFVYRDRFYLMKVGYDERFKRYAPGHLLKKYEIRECFENGLKEYDFLGQQMEWKMEWAENIRPQYTIFVYGKTPMGFVKYFLNVILLPSLRKITLLRKIKEKYFGK